MLKTANTQLIQFSSFTQKIGSFYSCGSSNSMDTKALIGLLLLVGCHGVSSGKTV